MMQDMYGIHNDEMLKKMLDLFKLEDNVLKGDTKHMYLGVKRKLASGESIYENCTTSLIRIAAA